MGKIIIIGAGAMGTAFAYPCFDNKHEVNVIGTHLENKSIDELNKSRLHPGLNLKESNSIQFFKYESMNNLFKNTPDLIVIGVSSKGIDWIAEELTKVSKNKNLPNLLLLTKGLSVNENKYEILDTPIPQDDPLGFIDSNSCLYT